MHYLVAEALVPPRGMDPFTFVSRHLTSASSIEQLLMPKGLGGLATHIWAAVRRLQRQEAPTVAALSSKFLQQGNAFELRHASLDAFYGGLDAKIGPPDPNIAVAISNEHVASADSHDAFTASNYLIATTPATEFAYVLAPDGRAADEWPREDPTKLPATHLRRRPLALEALARRVAEQNARLASLDEPKLLLEEAHAARLYTGPMFVKYNGMLRGFGPVLDGCKGNRYVTTTHAINSAIIKCSKLTKVGLVYRGVAGGVLPRSFWEVDTMGVRGGIESAFMSTTFDERVAKQYASRPGLPGIVFEMQMGMVDRGAELGWVSQYPHEQEVLLPPLTGVELRGTRIEGSVLIARVSLAINLNSQTIERVIARMQSAQSQLLHHLSADLIQARCPASSLAVLEARQAEIAQRDPAWFNAALNYRAATSAAFDAQREAMERLTERASWAYEAGSDADVASRMKLCAKICARAERLDVAVELLRMAEARHPSFDQAEVERAANVVSPAVAEDERWRLHVAEPLLRDGAPTPWPAVLAVLAETGSTLVGSGGSSGEAGSSIQGAIVALARRHVASTAPASLEVGAQVLAKFGVRWQPGRVAHVHHPPHPSPSPSDDADAAAHASRYDVLMYGWQVNEKLPASHCLLPGDGGVGALLRAAAARGNLALVDGLLTAGVSPHEATWKATTALHEATFHGHPKVCARLAKARADTDLSDLSYGDTAWRLASRHGGAKSFALTAAINPRSADMDFTAAACASSPLLRAASSHDEGWHGRLVAAVAELPNQECAGGGEETVNTAWANGVTALMAAARANHHKAVECLLGLKADANVKSKRGCTALQGAIEAGADAAVASLLASDAPKATNNDLGSAAAVGNIAAAKALIQKQAPLEYTAVLGGSGSSRGYTPLMQAAIFGQEDAVRLLLDASAAVDTRGPGETTALIFAATNGHTGAMSVLIDAEASLDAVSADGRSALLHAAGNGYTKAVAALLDAGCTVDLVDAEGESALFRALRSGRESTVRCLLQARASANLARRDGTIPLDTASYGFVDCIIPLLQAKADVSNPGPITQAGLVGDVEIVRTLLRAGASVNAASRGDDPGATALITAAQNGYAEVVAVMIANGAELDTSTTDPEKGGATALCKAATNGHEHVVRMLLSAQADSNVRKRDGFTALNLASERGNLEIVCALLDAGASVDLGTMQKNQTPLHTAASAGHLQIVRELLQHSASVHELHNTGDRTSPLISACFQSDASVVQALIDANAPLDHAKIDGWTPLLISISQGHDGVALALIDAGASLSQLDARGDEGDGSPSIILASTPLVRASQMGRVEIVRRLLHAPGVQVDASCNSGLTPLLCAATYGQVEVLRILLHAAADVEARNEKTGQTAIMCAGAKGHVEALAVLIDAGATVDARGAHDGGITALMWAAIYGHEEAARVLLHAKADAALGKTDDEMSPLLYAAKQGHAGMVEVLLVGAWGPSALEKANCHKSTPLLIASEEGHAGIVAKLLEHRADVTVADGDGDTSLKLARDNGHEDIVTLLLQSGALA